MEYPEFIADAGTCHVTTSVMRREGRVQWMIREKPAYAGDTGWRFMSQLDTSELLEDPSSWHAIDYNAACTIEPSLIGVWSLPVDSDLQLVDIDDRVQIWDTSSGQEISYEGLYLPPVPRPGGAS